MFPVSLKNALSRPVALGLAAATFFGLSACQSDNGPTEEAQNQPSNGSILEGALNLYSSRHYDTDKDLYAQFEAATGVELNLIEADDDELIERIKSEGANSPADVLITVDVARLFRAQEEGLLQAIASEKLDQAIPANLRADDGSWYGLTKRARVIVYDQREVNPEALSSYENLADPQWQGKICIRSSSNVYNQSLVAAMLVANGEEATKTWLEGFVANFAREPEGNDTAQIKAVAAGECDLALVNSYYVARLQQSESPEDREVVANLGVFFPTLGGVGTHINVSGAGVVASAPNRENAIAFLEYLATPEAQEIFANNNNEFPAVAGLAPNETVAAFGDFVESDLAISQFGEKNADAVILMDQVGWK